MFPSPAFRRPRQNSTIASGFMSCCDRLRMRLILDYRCRASKGTGRTAYMGVRASYGDALWRLAVARDREGLPGPADRLLTGDASYEGSRARAFALAVDGRLDAALAELAEGRLGDWPFPAAYSTDSARVRHLAGDDHGALRDLAAAARDADRLDPEVP